MYETTKLNIREAASMLEVNPETLRRWDKSKKLIARRDSPTAHRYYFEDDIVEFLRDNYKYLYKLAMRWAFSQKPLRLPEALYCQDSFIFKGRLSKLEDFLSKDKSQENRFPLVTSVIGEIGNNSFDHNIGNWPDVPGIFFGWSLKEGKIILIDRGLGILSTLKRVKPELKSDREALKIAFTKSLSGRGREKRGNGLKYVRRVVHNNNMDLFFQSGKACIIINKKRKDIKPFESTKYLAGTMAILNY